MENITQSQRKEGDRPPKRKDANPMVPRRTSYDSDPDRDIIVLEKVEVDKKRPKKPKRRNSTRRRPPSNDEANLKDEEEVGMEGSFRKLRLDPDKPESRAIGRRTSNDAERDKPRSSRRRLKGDGEGIIKSGDVKLRKDRHRNRDPVRSNDRKKLESNNSKYSSKRKESTHQQSERWMQTVESVDAGEVTKRAEDSLGRASDRLSLSQSAHSRIRRHRSSNRSEMTEGLKHRSYHGSDFRRRSTPNGRHNLQRPSRLHNTVDSDESFEGHSIDSFDEFSHSQGTLESVDDYEEFGEDSYGVDLETPGMVDFEEEMLDLMQRPNPEVTEHLDRRVHRKRELVAYDQNMPLMTRQALLTRQASAQVSRQYIDGKKIDKKRLLLRNDSMSSTHSRDELKLSSHRSMRSAHGRRGPPRTKSSGLGAMRQASYSFSGKTRLADSDDRRRVARSKSSIQSLTRRPSGDLIGNHSMRGSSRSNNTMTRRRPLQRANSLHTTSLQRTASYNLTAPSIPERKVSKEKNSDNDVGSEFRSDCESLTSSLKKSALPCKQMSTKNISNNNLKNKRNRSKLHCLMYKTKMGVDMNALFKRVREGERPRSPILNLRMPSP